MDTNTLSQLFRFYYRNNFPSLWKQFDQLVLDGRILSTREVMRELGEGKKAELAYKWALDHKNVFPDPGIDEVRFVSRIFGIRHFQQNLQSKKGKPRKQVADPFVIAQAKRTGGTVVTEESKPPNGARIPNICEHFEVTCINLQQLMDREGWEF
ncbi:MAG: DUF4411 family protein [Chloroflexi bacterium]|nr:DUF4411 family protein [Chloroflexota bacterium]